ncbi:hypothetical protein TNCV_5118061 [Trichonephila clavipes]|nr:hypothetical protein TNCV_5118061 [Trichonephila clavipes]
MLYYQKVYLSWPVPNCAEGCPSSWIRDGYCDKPCNNSQCQWDGGDCTADNPMLPFQAIGMQQEGGVTTYFHIRAFKNYCNNECADTWLADRYCDKACNIRECGYDAGDCGLENFHKIAQLVLLPEQSFYSLPDGENIGYFNLTDFFNANYTLTDGLYEESAVIRIISISLKYSVIGIVLYPNHNATNLTITLKGEYEQKPYEKKIFLYAFTKPLKKQISAVENTTILTQTEEAFTFESFVGNERFPKIYSPDSSEKFSKFQNVNASASQLPVNLTAEINNLKQLEETKKKINSLPAAYCAYSIETIMTFMWIHSYNVGPVQDDSSAGAGFYCENLFEVSFAAGLGTTNFDAEIEAVRQAICHLINLSTYRQAVFLVDSLSVILILCSLPNSDSIEVEEARKKIHELNSAD